MDCSCFVATRNDAATVTGVQVFVWTCVSSSLGVYWKATWTDCKQHKVQELLFSIFFLCLFLVPAGG